MGDLITGGKKLQFTMIPIYTDETTFLAIIEEELIELLKRMEEISSEVGLQINKNKTKIMIIDRLNNNKKKITQISNIQVMERFIDTADK